MAKRLKPGDVLELTRPEGLVYLHFLGKDANLGDGVRVSPRFWARRPKLNEQVFETGYVVFYPASYAVKIKFADVAGWMPTSGLPTHYRRHFVGPDGRLDHWMVVGPDGETLKRRLSNREKRYTIREILNDAELISRIRCGWRPENDDEILWPEQDDGPAPPQPRLLRHYLYVQESSVPALVAELARIGYETEARLSNDSPNWLVIATAPPPGSDDDAVAGMRDSLEELAARFDGEYDGWEATVSE